MLEVTIKLVGEAGSGKSSAVRALKELFTDSCPFDFTLEAWTEQNGTHDFTRELFMTNNEEVALKLVSETKLTLHQDGNGPWYSEMEVTRTGNPV